MKFFSLGVVAFLIVGYLLGRFFPQPAHAIGLP